jgi:hypothetical protein
MRIALSRTADGLGLVAAILLLLCPRLAAQTGADVVINEVLAANRSGLTDADNDTQGWVEIANRGGASVELLGWSLTDSRAQPAKWVFPDVALAAGEYLVVFTSGKDLRDPNAELHANFKLDPVGEYLGLYSAGAAREVASELAPEFPEQRPDFSYGIDGAGELSYLRPPTPGQANDSASTFERLLSQPMIHVPHGFYEEAFEVGITTASAGAEIRYTTDGSEPTESTGTLYLGPILIAGTTALRAAAFQAGQLRSRVETKTYLFLRDVIRQPTMRQSVVDDPAYSDIVLDAMKSIPTLSIVMAEEDFKNLQKQASLEGTKEELPASIELMYAEEFQRVSRTRGRPLRAGFQIDAAIEGHSHSAPKRSVRLKFKRAYGPTKLSYPFFESAPVNSQSAATVFDRLILRSEIGMSWSSPFAGNPQSVTLARDQWQRNSQIAMSALGAHGIFVHLYVNGRYWGLYNPVERPDARFTSSYLGGQEEDYFATNHGIERGDGHLSGDLSRFERLVDLASEGDLRSPERYEAVSQLLDIEHFADYVILFWFSGFGDGLDNNWYAGMRNDPPGRLLFFMWDSEYIFINQDPGPPANTGAWVPNYFFTGEYSRTRIARIFLALLTNPEFCLLFADRVYRHLSHGALTDENSRARFKALTDHIADAIIGESARWGGGRTRDEQWRSAVEVLDQRMSGNAERLIVALRHPQRDLYPAMDPPVFNQRGGRVPAGFRLRLRGYGEIYVTSDGTDPRLPGGAVAPTAFASGAEWSPLLSAGAEARFLVPEDGALALDWTAAEFDDAGWGSGRIGLGFARNSSPFVGDITTDIEELMRRKNSSVYVRIPFLIHGVPPSRLALRVKYDDGFVAYLNGTRVAARNASESPQWDSRATGLRADVATFENLDIPSDGLRSGRNFLAIHAFNVTPNGSDFLILPQLEVGEARGSIRIDRTTVIRARTLIDGEWSALNEATFVLDRLPALRVTELMYHPLAPDGDGEFTDDDFEYVEFRNVGASPILLAGMQLSGTIRFKFPADVPTLPLAPGEFALVVRERGAFKSRYGAGDTYIAGEFEGTLGNAGGVLTVTDPLDRTVLELEYSDDWYPGTDGGGPSLEIVDAQAALETWSDPQSWRMSAALGSPGEGSALRGGLQLPGDVDQSGELDLTDVLALLGDLFAGEPTGQPCEGGPRSESNRVVLDTNGDDRLNLTDAIYVLDHLFRGGPPPVLGNRCVEVLGCPDACTGP